VPKAAIHFQQEEGLDFVLKEQAAITAWIKKVIKQEGKKCGELLYFFCSDKYLLRINKDFLKHNTYTDIVTFDYSEAGTIAGEIYVSIDRIKENAAIYKQPFNKELKRVLIHGVLHLCGYTDKTEALKKKMRQKEDDALTRF
jgi:probable rRNA maturation factor